MLSTIIANNYPEDEGKSLYKSAPWIFDLIDDLYTQMNPIISSKESAMYYCTYGCDGFDYSCHEQSDYDSFSSLQSSGVKFYSSLVPYKKLGCSPTYCGNLSSCTNKIVDHYECGGHSYTSYCVDMNTCNNRKIKAITLSGIEYECGGHKTIEYCNSIDSCTNKTPIYICGGHAHCNGHSITSCYGHKDVDIYVSILSKEDIYSAARNGNVLTYYDYATGAYATKTIQYTVKNDMVTAFRESGGWTSSDNIEICEKLYNQDWYSIYGFDIYGGVGYEAGEVLSEEDIAAMLEKIVADYPDLSADRITFVSTALQYVGKIPYYWGGKASAPGWDENYFGTVVTPPDGRPDQILKGLDCSGFVHWIYWTCFNEKPSGYGTSNLVSSLGGTNISYNQLTPGDVALVRSPGSSGNHIGIYVGKNEDGKDIWVHCNDAANNVSCNNYSQWRYYYNIVD